MSSLPNDLFITIPLTTKTLDRYYIRHSIFKALEEVLPKLSGTLLDVGCGQKPYKEHILKHSDVEDYTGLDIETALEYDEEVKPDIIWDGNTMPFKDNSFNCAMATEVLEHCPDPEVVLNEVYRILKPGGIFFFTVPFLWNLHEVPHDEYRYTPFSLERHLNNCGFTNVTLQATGGWHAAMAQMLGLWVRRSYMGTNKRKLLSAVLKPIIKRLIAYDKPEHVQFKEGQMITGLQGVAYKPLTA
ncbi:class I SAM-dependent methyltransferase [Mangrovimonas spongiae]|uniref:Methyltransferase domain-containing protein n=1 Tax=Mangrovimonas spongiae TaxID=2494697 RepID=A0A428K2B1_9FLAO|nr:class I SAM-dependent methyltransferase [Mangrovimonas spongiae]RSK40515.1 methyltransferase domain-containing protein [Mangrovimonas spongiae]